MVKIAGLTEPVAKVDEMAESAFWMSPTLVQELIQAHGLWILFIGIMIECIGLPVPGETALILAALYAGSTNGLAIWLVVVVAATAATLGGIVGYLVGRSIGLGCLCATAHTSAWMSGVSRSANISFSGTVARSSSSDVLFPCCEALLLCSPAPIA
jgi:uncharacterized membrane protein YdjX (TVP38/TMEM64 family)